MYNYGRGGYGGFYGFFDIGGGGGGGGGYDFKDNQQVTPGESLDYRVATGGLGGIGRLPTNGSRGGAGAILITYDPVVAPSFSDATGDAISGTTGTAISDVTVPEASGVPTPTYAVHNNSLPAGLSFNTSTRTISGAPTSVGSGTITIRATNSEGTADWTLDYNIITGAPSFADATGDAISGTVGTAISDVVVPAASGLPTPTYAVHNNSLPAGLSFDPTTRVISGTPTSAGPGTVTIRATNSQGSADWTLDYNIITDAVAPTATIAPVAPGDEGTTAQLSAVLDSAVGYDVVDYFWSVNGGTLNSAAFSTPTWRRPAVTVDTDYIIDLVITARGTGTNATSGTSAHAVAPTRTATVRYVSRGALWLAGATPDAIYKSTNDGVTWSSAVSGPSGQAYITGIAVAPNGDLWLAGNTPDAIYKSTNDGSTWSAGISGPALQTAIRDIAVAPNGDLWLAGTVPDKIYKSTDNGATWSSPISGPALQSFITGIAVAPNGDLWLAGSSPGAIYKSTDDGATWSAAISGPSGQTSITGISVAPNGDLWLAGTTPDDVYKSTNDGSTWSSTSITGPAGQTLITGIAFDPYVAPAEQVIALDAEWFTRTSVSTLNYIVWVPGAAQRPQVNASLADGGDRYIRQIEIYEAGLISLDLSATPTGSESGADLSTTFEISGSVELSSGAHSFVAALDGAALTDPYSWSPSNGAEVAAFSAGVRAESGNQAATLTLRNFVPPVFRARPATGVPAVRTLVSHTTPPALTARAAPTSGVPAVRTQVGHAIPPALAARAAPAAGTPAVRTQVGHSNAPALSARALPRAGIPAVGTRVSYIDPPLVLADRIIPADSNTIFAGLIEVGVDGATRYRYDGPGDADNSGQLLDGDTQLTSNIAIEWMRVTSSRVIHNRRVGNGDFNAVLRTGQVLRSAILHLQDQAGVSSFNISGILDSDVGGGFFDLESSSTGGPDYIARLEALADGDRFILSMTQPHPALVARARPASAAPAVRTRLAHAVPPALVFRAAPSTGVPAVRTQVSYADPPTLFFRAAPSTGVPAVRTQVSYADPPGIFLRAAPEAGVPVVRTRFHHVPPLSARAAPASGAPVVRTRPILDLPPLAARAAPASGISVVRTRVLFGAPPSLALRAAPSSGVPAVRTLVEVDLPGVVARAAPAAGVPVVRTLSHHVPPLTARAAPAGGGPVLRTIVDFGGAPGQPTNVSALVVEEEHIALGWTAPAQGISAIIRYEIQRYGGTWVSTGSPLPAYIVTGLRQQTDYTFAIRAVNSLGAGPASATLLARTTGAFLPGRARGLRANAASGTTIALTWVAPETDANSAILYYEVCVIDESGSVLPFEPTDGPETTWVVRGLARGHTYGFRVRPVNAAGYGPQSVLFYGTPARPVVRAIPPGQRIPLIDTDRQSLIVRIADQDCRLRVWWSPSDESWWASIEVPVNTPAVMSRRLALNAGILDRIVDVLPGNIVMRALGGEGGAGAEPTREAWALPTHALMWEPRS